jgi:ubiquinone/menaquinone biosynthesis C-methylase UbiE
MKSMSFDSMVELYDETRVFDGDCFDAALGWLVQRFPPQLFEHVLEPGIGTGRIAIPLAERGYRVTGMDISGEMLALLQRTLARSGHPGPISFQRADTTRLPFPDAAFDMAIAVHLFYFIPQWKRAVDEILRVVRDEGLLVLMHTGTGLEIPFLNERYKELCAESGCAIKSLGVESTREVVQYLVGLGCHAEWIRERWQWTARIRLDVALDYVKSRAYSFTTVAPDDVHATVIEQLESELQRRFGGLASEVKIPNQVYLVLVSRRWR